MKTILLRLLWLVAAIVLAFVAVARSADVSKNPDRYPSIGVDLWKAQDPGVNLNETPLKTQRVDTVGEGIDILIPVTNTITAHGFGTAQTLPGDFPGRADSYKVGAGLRFYFVD